MKRRALLAMVFFISVFGGTQAGASSPHCNQIACYDLLIQFSRGTTLARIDEILQVQSLTVVKYFESTDIYLVTSPGNLSEDEMIKRLNDDPDVIFAEPDYEIVASRLPNDPYFFEEWALSNTGQYQGVAGNDIGMPGVWDEFTGSGSTIVAVVDSGIDYQHPDLAGNMWTNTAEIPGNHADDDHNGYVDDVYGYDFFHDDGDPMDDRYHGTHVAGTIGAVGDNGIGIAGVDWDVRLMALKFLGPDGTGPVSGAIAAIDYAVQKGAKVINNSWTFTYPGLTQLPSSPSQEPVQSLRTAIQKADEAGVIFVTAAGNDGANNDAIPHYPAAYTLGNIVAVAATDNKDGLANFSDYGAISVDLGAPGVVIFSTWPTWKENPPYHFLSGTSMAAPHVSGAAALLRAAEPGLTHRQVIDRILQGAAPVSSLSGKSVTGGRLDLAESFNLSNTSINHPPVANAGANQYRTVGNSIFLGGAATDSDGDSPLYYSWSLAKPSGSSAHLSATTTANVSFVADVAGTYTATLIANDGISPSLPSTVLIFVSAPVSNQPPTAFAGPNQLRRTGDTVLLMGKGTDPEGKPVTYQWSLTPPSGSSTNLMNASSATASFFADREGTFTAKLKVGDGTLSTTSTALVYIVDPVHNNPPTANAGPDQLRHPGDKVYVMGKAVDSDGDSPLNFKWTLTGPTGSASVLYNATLPTAYFYPDRLGIYTATLVTSDASSSSSPDSAKVYVVSAEVTDVATGSEMVEETPQVDLPDEPFDAPSSDEEEKQPLQPLSVLILAKDGRSGSDVDPDHGNHVTIGNEIILDGTGSEAGEAAVFEWTFVETPDGSEAKLVEAENGVARFVPDMPGRYTVGLKVSEGKLSAATERSFQAVEEPLDSEAQQESASMEAAGGGCSLVRRP